MTVAISSRSRRTRSDQLVTSGTRNARRQRLGQPEQADNPAPPARYTYTDAAVNAARSPA